MPAGNVADISFGIQTAKGTPLVATVSNSFRTILAGGWMSPNRTIADLEETSASRLRSQTYVQRVEGGGEPAFWMRDEMIGALLYGAMGGKTTTGAADPWTHTFVLAPTQPFLTFWTNLANLSVIQRFTDAKVVSLRLESSAGEAIRATANVLGAGIISLDTLPAGLAPVEQTPPFVHYHAAGALLVENTAVSAIDRWALNIGTGVEGAQGDNVTLDSVNEGMQDITLETSQILQNFDLWHRLHYGLANPADLATPNLSSLELGGAPAGIDFKWTRVGVTPGPERSLQITAPRLQITQIAEVEPNTSGSPIRQTVTYRVLAPAAGSGLTAVLKNGQTAY